jgi:hypothetical protein
MWLGKIAGFHNASVAVFMDALLGLMQLRGFVPKGVLEVLIEKAEAKIAEVKRKIISKSCSDLRPTMACAEQ